MSEHTCSWYCQGGEHAYVCLGVIAHGATDVLQAAQLWVTHLGWPEEVSRVQPAREIEVQQILQSTMLEVDNRTETVREVADGERDVTRYRPWLVFLRPRETHGDADADAGEETT